MVQKKMAQKNNALSIMILILLVVIVVLLSVVIINQYKNKTPIGKVIDGTREGIGEGTKEGTGGQTYSGYGKYHNVTRVIDGDTIVIEDGQSVRLICIDTPEKGEDYFSDAKNYLNEMILGKEILIENDVSERDKYNRLLGYLYLEDGTFINEKIVRAGWARAYLYYPDTKLCPIVEQAEAKAQEEKIGMWQEYNYSPMNNTGNYTCSSNTYNCGDFKTQAEAQAAYDSCGGIGNDIHRLDTDGDGKVCESLR